MLKHLRLNIIKDIAPHYVLQHIPKAVQRFYVSTIRCHFDKLTNNSKNMSKHVALQGAHVHQATLCVTFGAPHVRTHFRCLCASWSDLWASTPPRPPIIPKMGTSRHLLVNHPPHRCHPQLALARFSLNFRSLSPP